MGAAAADPASAQSLCGSQSTEPWCSSTAGGQALTEYHNLSGSQIGDGSWRVTPGAVPQPNGQPVYEYPSFGSTGSNTATFLSNESKGIAAASIAGRWLPRLSSSLATLTVGVTGFEIGWHVGNYFMHFVSSDLHGSAPQGQVTGTGLSYATPTGTAGSPLNQAGWWIRVDITGIGSSVSPYNCLAVGGICDAQWRIDAANAVKNSAGGPLLTGTSNDCSGGICRIGRKVDPDAAVTSIETWAGQTAPTMYTSTFTRPGDQGTAADQQAAEDTTAPPGATWGQLTPSQQATVISVVTTENPTWAPQPDYITVLAPGANETYASYIARLQAEGYVGSATSSELATDNADPTRGPSAVVKTSPAVGTVIAADAALAVYLNPSTQPGSTPGTETTTNDAGPATPAGTGCNGYLTASPDLTPLQGHGLSGVFPFAIFGWISTGLTGWSGTGTAPAFTVPLPAWAGHQLEVDFAQIDPAMPVVRATITIGATFLLVWWLATALLGLRGDDGS